MLRLCLFGDLYVGNVATAFSTADILSKGMKGPSALR
jgi:hypothetical protein